MGKKNFYKFRSSTNACALLFDVSIKRKWVPEQTKKLVKQTWSIWKWASCFLNQKNLRGSLRYK